METVGEDVIQTQSRIVSLFVLTHQHVQDNDALLGGVRYQYLFPDIPWSIAERVFQDYTCIENKILLVMD